MRALCAQAEQSLLEIERRKKCDQPARSELHDEMMEEMMDEMMEMKMKTYFLGPCLLLEREAHALEMIHFFLKSDIK